MDGCVTTAYEIPEDNDPCLMYIWCGGVGYASRYYETFERDGKKYVRIPRHICSECGGTGRLDAIEVYLDQNGNPL